ncbi:MAG: hypothetical protein AAGH79_03570 [Bacteroidota bacterium]
MRFRKPKFIQTNQPPPIPQPQPANEQESEDLGFGTRINSGGQRLINLDGTFNIDRRGARHWAPY